MCLSVQSTNCQCLTPSPSSLFMFLTRSPTSRSSVAQISWGSDSQVNVLVLCERTHTHTHTHLKPCNNMHFYTSHLASSVLTVCVCAVDGAVTPLLRRASGGKSGAGGREAVDPGRAGGEKTELHSCTSHHENISSSHGTLCCVITHQTFLPLLVVIKSLLSNFSLHSLQGIGGGATRSLMDQFAEVLFSLNKHCFSLLAVWLKEALQPPGFPSSRVTTEQKDNFSHQILR